jgi:hypothetical protein
MRRRIEFELAGEPGQFVTVEVEQPVEPGLERAARGGAVERAGETFETAVAKIKPVIGIVVDSLRDMVHAPDDLTIDFGITFDAKSGVILTSVGVQANLKVTVAWHKHQAAAKQA